MHSAPSVRIKSVGKTCAAALGLALALMSVPALSGGVAAATLPPIVPGTAYGVGKATPGGATHISACAAGVACISGNRAGNILGHRALGPGSDTLTFTNVMVPADGSYLVTWYYWGGDPNGDTDCGGLHLSPLGCRPAEFVLNGTPMPLSAYPTPAGSSHPGFQLPDTTSWQTEGSYGIHLPLKSGANSIEIYSTTADVDDLDQIIVADGSSGPPPSPTPTPCSGASNAPTNLMATTPAVGEFDMTWSAPTVCGPTPFYAVALYSAASNSFAESVVSTTSFKATGLTPGTYYIATVTAYNNVAWSAWGMYSNWVLVMAPPAGVQHTVKVVLCSTNTTGFCFSAPDNGAVHMGDTIVWQDTTGIPHGVAWDATPATADAPFINSDSTTAPSSVTAGAGTYHYHCSVHGTAQAGTITVA